MCELHFFDGATPAKGGTKSATYIRVKFKISTYILRTGSQ